MSRAAELEELFGISHERIVEIDEMMCKGILPGEPAGPVVWGRPPKFGEAMVTVSFKLTPRKIFQVDCRAASLGMDRSEYLRSLIDQDLESADADEA